MWSYNADKTGIVLEKAPARPKKLTGTRFASVLGLNTWSTPFAMFCEVTKCAMLPFEDNKFTLAGKAIEPILIDYFKDEISPWLVTPEEYFGNAYESVKWDFFPKVKIFGGMWDALATNRQGKAQAVIECKTSSRPQDWTDGVPVYYAIQGLLYAKLLGLDVCYFPVAFLSDDDYRHPEKFAPTDDNTALFELSVSEYTVTIDGKEYNFDGLMKLATDWYNTTVKKGISPDFDEKKDKDYLDILRAKDITNDHGADLDGMQSEYEKAKLAVEALIEQMGGTEVVKAYEKALKTRDGIKKQFVAELGAQAGPDEQEVGYGRYSAKWQNSAPIIDKEAMEADGVLDKYSKPNGFWRLYESKN